MFPQEGKLPDDFLWGAATSSHQVEGHQYNNWSVWEPGAAEHLAADAEERLKNVVPDWDAVQPEATDPQNYISGFAADHWNRYEEDLDILKNIGCNAYRFSIEWSRIEPEPGKYDQEALDHYADMVRAMVDRGVAPMLTMHHFTDPIWLEEHGGWHGDEVVERFGKLADVVAKELGEWVIYWCSINEPNGYLQQRYMGGGAAGWPKTEMNPLAGYKYLKNVVRAHKLARRIIKRHNPEAQVGMAHALIDRQLSRNDPASWLDKKWLDYVPDTYLINRLKDDIDYIGANYYLRTKIKSSLSLPSDWESQWDGSDPQNDVGWGIYPEGLYNVTQKLKKYNLPILITENGLPDSVDKNRGKFIREHIDAMKRSIADGADIRGYFHWSLLDNFEWSEGFWPKFGLVAVDRMTGERTVRASAGEYSKIIKENKSNL